MLRETGKNSFHHWKTVYGNEKKPNNNNDFCQQSLKNHDFIKSTLKKDANTYYLDLLKGCCKCIGIEEDWIIDNQNNKYGFQLCNFGQVFKNMINCTQYRLSLFGRLLSHCMVSYFYF